MLLGCISAYSQHWGYGIEVGYTNNRLQTKVIGSKPLSGFKVGGIIDYNFKSHILIETGIEPFLGNVRSGERDESPFSSRYVCFRTGREEMTIFAFMKKMNIKNKMLFIPQIGWFFNIGVQGSGLLSGVDNYNQPYTMGIDIFSTSNTNQYRPFSRTDTGPIFGLNIQYKKVRLKCSYELGIKPIHPIYGNPKNRTVGASVAYIL